jgi:hypothetical protein
MDHPPTIVTDPLGNKIRLSEAFKISQVKYSAEDEQELLSVLTRPAMIIEIAGEQETRRYYFRSLSWTLNLLLTTVEDHTAWDIVEIVENPDTDYLASLLKKGNTIFRL